jgi:hypothetical protein
LKASEYFKKYPINTANYEWIDENTVKISIFKEGWKRYYSFKVRNPYQKNEEIIEDEEILEKI